MLRRLIVKSALGCLLLAVACEGKGDPVDAAQSALLPNGGVFETDHDGTTYRRIAEYFAGRGLDTHVVIQQFAPQWPLRDAKSTVLNRLGTPIIFDNIGYYQTGFDVLRSDPAASADVLAPHGGVAAVFDWGGNKISTVDNPYATVVAIYDQDAHVITLMMHVAAAATLASSPDPVAVVKGAVVGQLARVPLPSAVDGNRLAHVHLVFVDGEQMKLLNPGSLFASYTDTVVPQARRVYVANELRKAANEFRSGKIDVVVEASDRDNDSVRNLEVSAIAFSITDQDDNVLAVLPRCSLDDIYGDVRKPGSFRAKDLIDFGSAMSQKSGSWPSSDVDNPERTFRYALTQLSVDRGHCTVKSDADGFLDVTDSVTKLKVAVTLWDAKGNQSDTPFEIARVAGSLVVDAGAEAGSADAGQEDAGADEDASRDRDN